MRQVALEKEINEALPPFVALCIVVRQVREWIAAAVPQRGDVLRARLFEVEACGLDHGQPAGERLAALAQQPHRSTAEQQEASREVLAIHQHAQHREELRGVLHLVDHHQAAQVLQHAERAAELLRNDRVLQIEVVGDGSVNVSRLLATCRAVSFGVACPSRSVAMLRRSRRLPAVVLAPVRKTCYFSDMKAPARTTSARQIRPSRPSDEPGIEASIARRVRRAKPGTVFTPALFAGVGSRAAIDKALQRLVARGDLRRLSRGLYDKPRQDPLLGTLWPSVDAVIAALTGKDKLRLQPTGAYAANLLGLSDQVPARVEFLTDGTSRTVKAGPMQIVLKRTTPRQMAAAGRTSGLVIQALRSLGADHLTPQRLNKLRRSIPVAQRRALIDDLTLAPGWLQPTLRALAAD